MSRRIVVIACGALATEVRALATRFDDLEIEVEPLPAELHDRPAEIAPRVAAAIARARRRSRTVFCAYAECGTRGALDRLLEAEGVERLPGAHCYEAFAGADLFRRLSREAPGSFYLTDFLALAFDRLVWRGLGLDREPALLEMCFGRYTRVVHLAQSSAPAPARAARRAAARLGLPLVTRPVGRDGLAKALGRAVRGTNPSAPTGVPR